jgi:hypothetical protein
LVLIAERRQSEQLLKRKDMADELNAKSALFRMRIARRERSRQRSTRIRPTSSGTRSFGVTRLGHNLAGIGGFGLRGKLEEKRYLIRTV